MGEAAGLPAVEQPPKLLKQHNNVMPFCFIFTSRRFKGTASPRVDDVDAVTRWNQT
jgi:hypothetical protein